MRLYLDVDGVLNAYGRQQFDVTGAQVAELLGDDQWDDYRLEPVMGYGLTLSKKMTDAIWNLGLEIQFLTSWDHDANAHICPVLGWPQLPVAGECVWRKKLNWTGDTHTWKWNYIKDIIAEEGEHDFIWIDDDAIGPEQIEWANTLESRVLCIIPNPLTGIKPSDIEAMKEFING